MRLFSLILRIFIDGQIVRLYITHMTDNNTAKVNVSMTVHEKVKKACEGTGYKLQVFYDRALMTYLSDHAADIKTEKETMLKTRGKR